MNEKNCRCRIRKNCSSRVENAGSKMFTMVHDQVVHGIYLKQREAGKAG